MVGYGKIELKTKSKNKFITKQKKIKQYCY